MATTTFDPVAFKATTRKQWEAAAGAWHAWGPAIERWLGPATERMLDMADVGPGDRVLDVAAGAGGQSLAAARRVGPTGRVLATDIAPAILRRAAAEARAAGLANVETRTMDGEDLGAVEEGSFDGAISRVGLIYFPDRAAALAGIRRALRPGGRVGLIVYSTPERNAFFSIPVGIIRRRAELPPPLPGHPGPFSLGAAGVLAAELEEAGFRGVRVEAVEAPVRMASAAECLRFERESFGALHQMLAGLSDEGRADAWAEIEQALGRFERDGGFEAPCELIVAAGTR
jgi:SAM-dependent methyltransferase